ncbi:gamma carbonic anhydrase family protein [bacterium]|nr:gamma carbonic anhydrase family protein [bacterium]
MDDFSQMYSEIHPETFIAPGAWVIGRVILRKGASVWYNSVLRGDIEEIIIGADSNIQDNCVVHVESDQKTRVGDRVTVGHHVVLHACTVEYNCLIGMGSVLLDGCHISENSVVAAGSVIPPGKKYPPRSLILGSPARVKRELKSQELEEVTESAQRYKKYWEAYLKKGIPIYRGKKQS